MRAPGLSGLLLGLVALVVPIVAAKAAVIENPPDGEAVSGVGTVAGWKCPPNDNIDIVFDDDPKTTVPAATRISRGDTAAACKNDGRNGFIIQFNYNLLEHPPSISAAEGSADQTFAQGDHAVAALQDGKEFARNTFHVTTFGTRFLRDAEGQYELKGFPGLGQTATIAWSQATQNFEIVGTGGSPVVAPTPTATPRPTPSPKPVGVCGVPVGSTPVLCSFQVIPATVSPFGSISLRFGIEDAEGDIDKFCLGLAAVGGIPVIQCDLVSPRNTRFDEVLTVGPVSVGGLSHGTYKWAFNVGDKAGHISNTVTATFSVN